MPIWYTSHIRRSSGSAEDQRRTICDNSFFRAVMVKSASWGPTGEPVPPWRERESGAVLYDRLCVFQTYINHLWMLDNSKKHTSIPILCYIPLQFQTKTLSNKLCYLLLIDYEIRAIQVYHNYILGQLLFRDDTLCDDTLSRQHCLQK